MVRRQEMHLGDVLVESFGDENSGCLPSLDAAALMVQVEVRHGHHFEPYAELTPLGWVIVGPISSTRGPGKRVLRAQVMEAEDDISNQFPMF